MDFIRAVGKDIYAGDTSILLRGFGLGGWFLPEGYMWKLYSKCDRPRKMEAMIKTLCGKDYADFFWKKYFEYYITEKDIAFIAEEGFNSIRLPLNARHLYEIKEKQLILNNDIIEKIDELIGWCRHYHIYVILDMHGAPGGQTGQNIDDSEADQPLLFMDQRYEEELAFLWRELAKRYAEEPAVAGYDLLNEPLPNFFNQYNNKVLPLYRKLIREIRDVDKKHMIILEGVHWSTDFSIFDAFAKNEASDNIMLQFHRYWSNPDVEGIQGFINKAEELSVPLFMGEGGENNNDWYTTAFPLYEQLNISWNFWSYKKMNCSNSPITFDIPEGWNELIEWIGGSTELSSERAINIFNRFLYCIHNSRTNMEVIRSLKREVPIKIPCEAYNAYRFQSVRKPGAALRVNDPVTIIFANGRTGEVDYRGHGGAEQRSEENLLVLLSKGDSLGYQFISKQNEVKVTISAEGQGVLQISLGNEDMSFSIDQIAEYSITITCVPGIKQYLWLTCNEGAISLDNIYLAE